MEILIKVLVTTDFSIRARNPQKTKEHSWQTTASAFSESQSSAIIFILFRSSPSMKTHSLSLEGKQY